MILGVALGNLVFFGVGFSGDVGASFSGVLGAFSGDLGGSSEGLDVGVSCFPLVLFFEGELSGVFGVFSGVSAVFSGVSGVSGVLSWASCGGVFGGDSGVLGGVCGVLGGDLGGVSRSLFDGGIGREGSSSFGDCDGCFSCCSSCSCSCSCSSCCVG